MDAMMVFVRRVMAHDGGDRVTQLQELSMLRSIAKLRDELHDREQLRFADRGGGKLFVDRGYDGVTKVFCGRPEEVGVGLGEPVAAPPCRSWGKSEMSSRGTR